MDGNEQYFHRSPEDEGFPVFNQTVSAVTGCPYAARPWTATSSIFTEAQKMKVFQYLIKPLVLLQDVLMLRGYG